MINLKDKNHCICPKLNANQTPKECENRYTISEEGKSIKIKPKQGEKACAIVLDGCVINDKKLKCDALFLFENTNKKVSFLVELKGAGNIEKAFEQLEYTKNKRVEYANIIDLFSNTSSTKIKEKFIIISNGYLTKPQQEDLEGKHNIKISHILHSEATTPIPDLRDYL